MIKKIIALVSLLCISLMCLCSCGEEPEKTVIGKWVFYGDSWGYTFSEGGSGSTFGMENDYKFEWKEASEYTDEKSNTVYKTKDGYDGMIVLTVKDNFKITKKAFYYRYGESDKFLFLADVTWAPDHKDEKFAQI